MSPPFISTAENALRETWPGAFARASARRFIHAFEEHTCPPRITRAGGPAHEAVRHPHAIEASG